MQRALAAAHPGGGASHRSALSRRGLLRGTAAAAAASIAGAWPAGAETEEQPQSELRVAIVGGGAAGLTAAYRLQSQGLKPVVLEAGNRWGGRILTVPDFYRGMFAELGGELVDTRHEDLKALAEELGLSLEPFSGDPAERERDLYFFGGKLKTARDMLDASAGAGAFIPIAQRIAADRIALRDEADAFTAPARALDAISLADYLKQFRGKTEDWAIDLIAVAYTIEFGLDPAQQSSLNLVDFISADPKAHFQIFGESDQAFRIAGGSSRLTDALAAACEKTCDLRLGAELTAIARRDNGIELTCGAAKREMFDAVVLALPFTRLRLVKGVDALGLKPLKLKAIRELGYGNNMKLVCGTASRAWRTAASLPHPSNGAFYADLPFQNVWEFEPRPAGPTRPPVEFYGGRRPARNPGCGLRKPQKRPLRDLARHRRGARQGRRGILLLGQPSLEPRQLRLRESRPIHLAPGGGGRQGMRRAAYLRGRAHRARVPGRHERRRHERQSRGHRDPDAVFALILRALARVKARRSTKLGGRCCPRL